MEAQAALKDWRPCLALLPPPPNTAHRMQREQPPTLHQAPKLEAVLMG